VVSSGYNVHIDSMPAAIDLNSPAVIKRFRRQLLSWYRTNQRRLPWRVGRNPYRIWISEIMLQQTRVAAVLEHYRRFLKRFPSIRDLADAKEADVLAAWSGLGYYRRARMMHQAARFLAEDRNAVLPCSSSELRQLPGIGRYTANAIASIAFGEPVAVVDGNVERVLTRLLGKRFSQIELWDRAQTLLDADHPGDFNQAMMELGAMVCLPRAPVCGKCPVKRLCASGGRANEHRNAKMPALRRSASLLLAQRRGALLLCQRSSDERLMPGMWEFPRIAGKATGIPLLTVRHSITTTNWLVRVFHHPRAAADVRQRWISLREVSRLPLTGLTRKILRKLDLLA
jgi:A/G-specific adenine glycosylase